MIAINAAYKPKKCVTTKDSKKNLKKRISNENAGELQIILKKMREVTNNFKKLLDAQTCLQPGAINLFL